MDTKTSLTASYIKKYFSEEISIGCSSYEQLRNRLAKYIAHLLDYDFSTLLNTLYRIDIPEKDLRQSLAHKEPALDLSEKIIRRLIKKVEIRMRYSTVSQN